ncbi:photosystem I reaction center subunit N [Hibiscus syriacus]|uniref:Photosystem I reaction center subunit N n=1 Tax=Hibiscus syriacus TaxID=106335 RepID=A0A6A2Y1U2_HIBSY|nr:probable polygalacturonase [Hibiscus syriacus]KAE8663627.1 photosystem I reaction center subunit N [Hibiscus syriacus]
MESEKPNYGAIMVYFTKPSWAFLVLLFTVISIFSLQIFPKSILPFPFFPVSGSSGPHFESSFDPGSCAAFFGEFPIRKHVMSLKDFGGVGDGKTSRYYLDPEEWPIVEPLPSYGRGRERLGGRHISLIHGNGLTNVVITGNNGTIDGQGRMWWELWWNRTLNHTRGHLVELMNSHNILISNLTFQNSPFWTIHPIYCSNVVVKGMKILAPLNAPNTDGIDPDSSTNVCIEDCYIESGDDLVAVKSGWDQYGIRMARPSSNIKVRRISGTTPTCSGVGIGSEMSGGIFNVTIEDMHVWNSAAGVRIKTDKGRGGYIANITIRNITMERVKIPIRLSRGSNDHPDDGWDPKAMPKIKGIFISNIFSLNSTKAPVLAGIHDASFEGLCFKNLTLLGLSPTAAWHCEFVSGCADSVFPLPCPHLQNNGSSACCS